MTKIELYTDGSCDMNGKGGWAFLLRETGTENVVKVSGSVDETTNNRMELTAVIMGFRLLDDGCQVELWADSKYVLDGLRSWIHKWKKNNWQKSDKKPVKNKDLWESLDELRSKHKVSFHWVKGHNNHPENEEVDQMALKARQ